jgi:hypothetical protein
LVCEYLSIQIRVGIESKTIDMSSYVISLVNNVGTKVELSPGTMLSFKVNENSPKLGEHEMKLFYSLTTESPSKAGCIDHGILFVYLSTRN